MPSYVLPASARQAAYGRLGAFVQMRIVVDKASIAELTKQLDASIRRSALETVVELGRRATEFLQQFDSRAGRPMIARMWTATPPKVESSGRIETEVYNAGEYLTFQTKSHAPYSTQTYPIKGANLLQILINGARPHRIPARAGLANPLQFRIVAGQSQSRSVGSAFVTEGLGIAKFLNPKIKTSDDFIETVSVDHPGVVGSRSIQAATQLLERVADTAGNEIAERVNQT